MSTSDSILSHGRMTRARLFHLIESFEMDMRRILNAYVLDHLSEEDALGPNFESADLRKTADGGAAAISDFLDVQECYDILNRHRNSLPHDLASELRTNTALVSELIPIRNRVMHGRPLLAGDPERMLHICSSFISRYWEATSKTRVRLATDTTWEPALERQDFSKDRILHNLPLPEYDETGLIGRANECKAIANLLMRRRGSAVTIIGEGGIGKTAVALETAYALLDDPDCPYDCILWTSLKSERLTTQGIVSITDAVRTVAGAAGDLGKAMVSDFTGGIAGLAQALEGITALLIIDNLETVSGSEFMAIYDELPESVSYLLTSRIGIGQVERKYPLGPLQAKDAGFLLRNFAKAHSVSRLATLSPKTMSSVVEQLRFSPLAIRWYVLAVEAGQDPLATLRNQDELLDFCVRSVYERMENSAKRLLGVLFSIERTASFEELAVLTDSPIDDLRRSAHNLLAGSMVAWEVDPEAQLVSRVRLTETAQQFLRRVSPPSSQVSKAAIERDEALRASEERRQADQRGRLLDPVVVRTSTDKDRPAAFILRQALVSSKRNDITDALGKVDKARQLDPDFWEVDRVEAFILSSVGRIDRATDLYHNSFRNAPDDEARAVVSHFFSGHLARKEKDLVRALEHARRAHEHLQSADTANALGNLLVWQGKFDEGQQLFEQALDCSKGKTRRIAITSLADSWRRWAENEIDAEKNPAAGFQKARTGFELAAREVKAGTHDFRLADAALANCLEAISAVMFGGLKDRAYGKPLIETLEFVWQERAVFERCRSWDKFIARVGRLAVGNYYPPVKHIASKIAESRNFVTADGPPLNVELRGRVKNWKGGYGFVEHPSFPASVFFPASALVNVPPEVRADLDGRLVLFTAVESRDGRIRSDSVSLLLEGEGNGHPVVS